MRWKSRQPNGDGINLAIEGIASVGKGVCLYFKKFLPKCRKSTDRYFSINPQAFPKPGFKKICFKQPFMVLILKSNATDKEIAELERLIYKEEKVKGFNAKKYNGVLQLQQDPLAIQKRLRDEWERNFS